MREKLIPGRRVEETPAVIALEDLKDFAREIGGLLERLFPAEAAPALEGADAQDDVEEPWLMELDEPLQGRGVAMPSVADEGGKADIYWVSSSVMESLRPKP